MLGWQNGRKNDVCEHTVESKQTIGNVPVPSRYVSEFIQILSAVSSNT